MSIDVKRHVCPSNITWIKLDGDTVYHLVYRLWQGESAGPSVSHKTVNGMMEPLRSDGMFWNVLRNKTLCEQELSQNYNVVDTCVGLNQDQACTTCWNRRI